MEKIIVQPAKVRGLGNIVDIKTVNDFTPYDSKITSASETINGVTTTVYTLTGDLGGITLTVTKQYVAENDTITLTAQLRDANGDYIEDAEVSFYKEA